MNPGPAEHYCHRCGRWRPLLAAICRACYDAWAASKAAA